jgi:hypothetical protein
MSHAATNDDDAGASAMSISRFCRRNSISEPFFFKLKANGLGPRTMNVGKRTLITNEAEADWRKERERQPVSVEALDRARKAREGEKQPTA